MLKLLFRNVFSAVILLLALVAPSALAAHHSHTAISRATHHRAAHRGKRHHAKVKRHAKRKTLSLVASSTDALVSTAGLIGDGAVESQVDYVIAGQSEAFRLQSLASGVTGIMHVYLDSHNKATTLIVGVYNNAAGHPGSLLSTGSASNLNNGAWNNVAVTPTRLTAGTTYWLAILGEGGTLRYRDRNSGPCPSETSAQSTLRTMPATWKTGTLYTDCPVSGYITATEPVFTPPAPVAPLPEVPASTVLPTNTVLPTIGGSTVEGQVLNAAVGSWSGEPTSYGYQWQDCNAQGASCLDIGGATGTSYTLTSGDVGHTLRLVVTATNNDGSTPATSLATTLVETITPPSQPPPPPPPSAPTNTAMPTISGTAIEGHRLNSTDGNWSGNPTSYSYQWRHCSSSGRSCTNIGGATASSYTLAASDVGHTMRVMVTAANEGGANSMSSPTTAQVTASAPVAPVNTAPPLISGAATEGQQLSATEGVWTGSPSSYVYQWQDCNSSGTGCVNVSGATSSSYTLGSSDVSHTMRVLVTATNAGGSTQVSSAQSATVIARTSAQTGCFSAPGACGYPDPNYSNVGPSAACSSLTPSGGLTVSTAGATIQNMNITGEVTISAKNVTLTNDCLNGNGYHILFLNGGATGFHITNSDVFGSPAVQEAINNNNDNTGAVADHDYIYNCGECVHGAWTLTNSYVTSNATISGEHSEDIYCSDETFVAEHDVLSNPHEQTANLFCNANGGSGGAADNHVTLTNSLLAGSGYSLYPQGNSNSVGTSTMKIVGNRFARCLTTPVFDKEGDVTCSGGADQYGYWPNGGYYGIDAYIYCPPAPGQEWSNNVWDDNNESIGC